MDIIDQTMDMEMVDIVQIIITVTVIMEAIIDLKVDIMVPAIHINNRVLVLIFGDDLYQFLRKIYL
jgi:hypothetical protein